MEIPIEGQVCQALKCVAHKKPRDLIWHQFGKNWFAVCNRCHPTISEENVSELDGSCSCCRKFVYAVGEPSICDTCGGLLCLHCETWNKCHESDKNDDK